MPSKSACLNVRECPISSEEEELVVGGLHTRQQLAVPAAYDMRELTQHELRA